MTPLDDVPIETLLARYAEAAEAHGKATEAGRSRVANEAYEVIVTIYRELRRRGLDAQRKLLTLLDHPDPGVRGWAGSHVLDFAPDDGERTLLAMSETPRSFVSFSAKMTLKLWRTGKLTFP